MSEPAQIILAIAVLLGSLKGIIWVVRCPKDSPHYQLPRRTVFVVADRQGALGAPALGCA